MTPERWAELKSLLASALALPDAERFQFIEDVCARTPELGGQLRSFLRESHLRGLGSDLHRMQEPDPDPAHPPSPSPALRPGSTVGPYEIVSGLGQGGMGEVFLARDSRLQRDVAIKVVRSPFLQTDQVLHEARALARLSHPHIATLYDVISEEGRLHLVMEYLSGETLALRLERGPLPVADTVRYVTEVAQALDYAHAQGVLHCDLKPGNVCLAGTGGVKVLDFGLARFIAEQSDALVGGTPPYMAPEQYFGGPIDTRTDVYALGVMLLQMTRGRLPGQATIEETQPQSATVDHATLRAVIARATAFDPAERYSSASELARDLATVGDDESPGTPVPVSFVATGDGVRLALAATGAGPVMIHVRGWVTHLHHLWADDQYRRFVESLAVNYRVIRYDGRGNGLADRVPAIRSLDELVEDLETIASTVTSRPVILLATCFGGPIAIRWAERRPERVAALVLDGTFLKGDKLTSRTRRMLLRRGFAVVPEFAFLVLSYLTNSSAVGRSYRNPATLREMIEPTAAASLYELAFSMDVAESARRLRVPTLVLHRNRSTAVPIALGREVAMAIPGSTFVELSGAGHNPWDQETDDYVALIHDFMMKSTGIRQP